ncbi:MAG: NAD(P)H-dependent oxidoreductase [Prevotella sp.]|nr:NAD(P)H-dependent oxidoreductase [Prevotella sp.]
MQRCKQSIAENLYADLPWKDLDNEFPAPAAVARVRREITAADGLWIFTPEYNFSYPGHVKTRMVSQPRSKHF